MIDARSHSRAIALAVIGMLVAASTLIPSLAYAQKYADHLSQYGGYDARVAALSGFSALYLNPRAPMLPVVLSAPTDADPIAVLPSPCAMDKTVLTSVAPHAFPTLSPIDYTDEEARIVGIHPVTQRGPPRASA